MTQTDARLKVIICINTAWNLVNFREGLIRALVADGCEVVAVAPEDRYAHRLAEMGCRFIPLTIKGSDKNPFQDLLLLWRLLWLMRKERPNVYLAYTVKPNIYGSLAAHFNGIRVINNVAGLGDVFMREDWLTWLVRRLYRLALSRSQKVFFQNSEDESQFVASRVVAKNVTGLLPGSGVDLKRFCQTPMPTGPTVRFLLVARMLRDKGITEFVEAARLLKQRGVKAEFCLLGFLDPKNSRAISEFQMEKWVKEGVIKYLGISDDVREEISRADCIVLPSYYREGTPRILLEAGAMARPIVTTDHIGCRDVVDHGVTGFLCRTRDAKDLADKMTEVLSLTPSEREDMGKCGRRKVESQFDEKIIISKYMSAIESCAV